jgi:D-aminopeptidase
LFSATMPPEVEALARKYLRKPTVVQVGRRSAAASTVTHAVYPVPRERKSSLLAELLRKGELDSVLVFTRTKHGADRVVRHLEREGIRATAMHADKSQAQRTQALDGFKRGAIRVLVATDIAQRGLDISGITHVINYDVPQQPEDYVLRIGRTGRAAATGDAYTFNSWIKDQLEPGAEYVSGHRWGCYMDPFRDGCDALLVVGAHSMGGTPDGVLSHTMSGSSWYRCSINGREVGEVGMMAALAGSFDVPLIFVSGDEAVCRETPTYVGDKVVTAAVKKGLGRFTARYLAPTDAHHLIEENVARALNDRANWPKPWRVPAPVELKVELMHPDQARSYMAKSGLELEGTRTVVSTGQTFWEVWDRFWKL